MNMYAEVVLPVPLKSTFTYEVPPDMAKAVKVGHRVLVNFGQKKFYTAIVVALTNKKPGDFEVKPIVMPLDDSPILRHPQLKLWQWTADYYLCSLGEVMKAALPAALKVESETFLELCPDYDDNPASPLSEREAIVMQILAHTGKRMSLAEIQKASGYANVSVIASSLLERGALIISEKLVERYVPRKITYVKLIPERYNDKAHKEMFAKLRTPAQEQALMQILKSSRFTERGKKLEEVALDKVREITGLPRTVFTQLEQKGIIEIYKKTINRFKMRGAPSGELPVLSEAQQEALRALHRSWLDHEVTLLHGVTSSGKTEIYIHLIDYVLKQKRQVLYLVPEIALTTQLTERLQNVFGSKVVVYHSKFSDSERVDIYRRILDSNEPLVIVGPRSAVFLPFGNTGLIIVDEEHETSYKQQDPAPRYNGRDTAMILARMHGAKTLLGSATPAIDTYYKALTGRYGLVTLSERYGGVKLPQLRLIDIAKAWRTDSMLGALASDTVKLVRQTVKSGYQSIIFLNRRGYAPVAQCKMCAWVPKCEHCDVSLTYHKNIDRLVCHYCGTVYPLPVVCPACKEPAIEIHGYGTERLEDEIGPVLGNIKVLRMDLDTTRNKDGYQHIISEFSKGKAEVLVGTQMVTKGLDFDRVKSVAIINTDAIINQPDFRASERAFNMISQVAGRAGRRDMQGEVVIQTRQPDHPLFRPLMNHDYLAFYNEEIEERRKYNYPPFTRLIYIYIKHRDAHAVEEIASAYANRLRQLFGNRVFGPEEPAVGRVQSFYIRKLMLKIEINASMMKVREILRSAFEELHAARISSIRSAVIYYDVDPM